MIVPKLEYAGEVWEGNDKFVRQLETVQMKAAKKDTRMLKYDENPLKTNRDVGKLKWQYKIKNMPEKRLPAIVDRAVWEKTTKGRAGIRWDNVVEKIWKELRGDQEYCL